MKFFRQKNNPIIKVWSGTKAHMSWDTRLHKRLVEILQLNGFNAQYRGDWSIEKLTKGKMAIVTHPARGAYRYRYTPSQTDAEKIILNIAEGKFPKGIVAFVTAHRHTSEGSIDHLGIKIIRVPCFTTHIPYGGSLAMFPHYQPDIGAWFLIVTKSGRIRTQEWLYKTFLYQDVDDEVFIAEDKALKSYATIDNYELEEHLNALLKTANTVIMIVADTHIGEIYSVAPPEFSYEKRSFSNYQTKANKILWDYWKHLCYMAKNKFNITEAWFVGDIFAGTNPFEKYRMPTLTNLDLQVYQALELFKQLR